MTLLLDRLAQAREEGWDSWIRNEADEQALLAGYYFDIKAAERVHGVPPESALDGVPRSLPQLIALATRIFLRLVLLILPVLLVLSACFAGLKGEKSLKLGSSLRFFGDGWQVSKLIAGRRFWRIPVMDGEFLCIDQLGLGSIGFTATVPDPDRG